MTEHETVAVEPPIGEPTLAAVLTHAVRTTVPTRLYQLLHLAFPLAIDFVYRGWWRPAAAAIAITSFGAWGLADRWLWNSTADTSTTRLSIRLMTFARTIAGVSAASLALLLLLELFLRALGDAPGH
jgi:hypothetical protein